MKKIIEVVLVLLVLTLCGCQGVSEEPWERNEVNLLSGFRNMYNPHILKVPEDEYPYKMYFFGWLTEVCNTGYAGCDAIFVARSQSLDGPWEVYAGTICS